MTDKKFFPLTKPYISNDEIDRIRRVFNSGWVSGQGPASKEFEYKISSYVGTKYAVSVSNCTAALHLSLIALGIKKGDEVLVSDYTFPATAHAVMYVNAKPIFVDVNTDTYNISIECIMKKISDRTKAIIPVHTFGQSADMHSICKIAKEYDLKVVEDAACSLGSRYGGKNVGSFGHTACFSFHARKNITTGEGGIITTSDERTRNKIRMLSCFGAKVLNKKFISISRFIELGYNYKLSDIAAAMGISQLDKLNKIIKRRTSLADYYSKKLESVSHIRPPIVDKKARHVYQSYVCLLDKQINRDKIVYLLKKEGIHAQTGTYSCHMQPVYRSKNKCPNSLELFKRSIALPMYYELTFDDIDYIVKKLKKVLNG